VFKKASEAAKAIEGKYMVIPKIQKTNLLVYLFLYCLKIKRLELRL